MEKIRTILPYIGVALLIIASGVGGYYLVKTIREVIKK